MAGWFTVHPAWADASLLYRLQRLGQDKSQSQPVRRPQVSSVEVPGPLPDLNDQSCDTNPMLRSARISYSEESRKSSDIHVFLDTEPSQKLTGIALAQFVGTRLRLQLVSLARFLEYSGPVAHVVEKRHYEASPGTALIGHTLTLGLGLVLAPVNSVQHALGCTDTRVIRREVMLQESTPTGQSQWRAHEATHVLRIDGLGASREINFSASGSTPLAVFEFELLPLIMQAPADEPVNLRVTCLSCNAQDGASVSAAPPLQNQAMLRADFSQDRADELARRERLALEESARRERLAQEERQAQQRWMESQQALANAKRLLVGRWATLETCLSLQGQDVGQIFELDGSERLSWRLRSLERGDQVVERWIAQEVWLRPAASHPAGWELSLQMRGVQGTGLRPMSRVMILRLNTEQMQIIDQRDGGNTVVRAGVVQSTGREAPVLYNCHHPKLVAQRAHLMAQRAQMEREERERVRREQAAAEEQRLRLEREEADRQRRQLERERLYKM